MDLAQLSSIIDVQQLRELVIDQMAVLGERDAMLADRDAKRRSVRGRRKTGPLV